jgi:hypothetical protein
MRVKPMEELMKTAAFGAITVAALIFASPAFAQANAGTMRSPAMSQPNTVQSGNMMSAQPAAMSCQQMMDKANGMHQPSDIDKRDDALAEMDKAKAAQAGGNESVCQRHAQKVIHDKM